LEFPDLVLANHVRHLLEKLSDDANRVLRLAILYDIIELQQINIDGLSWEAREKACRECVEATLLHKEDGPFDTSSMLSFVHRKIFYQVPQEFRETLKRLLYSAK
jgi:hypothetical protein